MLPPTSFSSRREIEQLCGGVETYYERSLRSKYRSQGVQTSFYESTPSPTNSLGDKISTGSKRNFGHAGTDHPYAPKERDNGSASRLTRVLLERISGKKGFRRVASSHRSKESERTHSRPHFRMFTTSSVLSSVEKGDYAFKIDLQDAYFHVPIHPSSRKYLRFAFENRVYQFRVLPFGLNTAPQVFTRLGHTVTAYLHRQGVSVIPYLDDWLVHHPDRQILLRHQALLLDTLDLVGFILNQKKSELDLTQDLQFLGIHLRLDLGRALLPESKAGEIVACARHLSSLKVLNYSQVSHFMGSLNWASGLIPLGRLYLRPLQRHFHSLGLTNRFTPPRKSDPVVLANLLRQWLDPHFLTSGIPIRPFQADYTIFTDASNQGWGAHMGDSKISGIWTHIDRKLHINCLELKAVICALQHWAPLLQGHQVMIATDNSTVVSYINKQGGTRSTSLLRLTVDLFLWLESQDIVVRARHIPGCLNVIADHLSRPNQPIPTEWSLHPEIVNRIFRVWGTPEVDMFATLSNSHLPRFMSPVPEPRALAVDALSQDWQGRSMYMFPPFPLLSKVVQKLRSTQVAEVILIAPWWPSQPWFPHLLRLCVEHPLFLPYRQDLLSQQDQKYISDGKSFHLHVWRLSCDTTKQQAFQTRFLGSRQPLGDPRPIKGYRTCIGSVLNRTGKTRVVLHRTISDMIASMELQRPRATPILPQWDLGVVLEALNKPPYEPLREASFKHLTLKTVFLLAMASAGRRSELHALRFDRNYIQFKPKGAGVTLYFSPEFMRKNQKPNQVNDSWYIPAIPTGKPEFGAPNCPVRALRYYHRYLTEHPELRKDRRRLFVPIKDNNAGKELSAPSISRWICTTIVDSHAAIQDSKNLSGSVKAHEVRAVATSLQLFNKADLHSVMKAGRWSSGGTFTSF